ncbi:MAG: succinate dehydrogenase cytochrome b subunit [Oligoflexia bacterium]|nr:succinate dehydrogenase cytochrome b subunit [Oligoflexia bacterium]
MTSTSRLFTSSIGKKYLMGITGLCWSLFVLMHMLANILIFVSPRAYNAYSHILINNPLIYLAEAGLVLLLLTHVYTSLKLTIENRLARGERAFLTTSGDKGVAFASKTMAAQGALILAFTILHIATFKYGTYYEATYDGVVMRDLHRLVLEVFQIPAYVGWYLLSLVILGFHLSHGFQSSFQSLGFHHPRHTPALRKFSLVYGVLIAIGFISQPVYVYFFHRS